MIYMKNDYYRPLPAGQDVNNVVLTSFKPSNNVVLTSWTNWVTDNNDILKIFNVG